MLKKLVFATLVGIAAIGATSRAGTVCVGMDKQINLDIDQNPQSPFGEAIYTPISGFENPRGPVTFETDGTEGWTRHTLPGGGWYYLYLDLGLAGIGTLDLSKPGASISFDARFFQDPQTNTNPYGDAPIFLRAYEYAANYTTLVGYKDFSIVWATQAPWNNPIYPEWSRATVMINEVGTPSGSWSGKVNRIRWYGTDWSGTGKDFIDIKDVCFDEGAPAIPEPGSMALLLTGALPFVIRRRKA